MKLLNHTLLYLSASLVFILSIWAVIFYFSMMDEVYDSIDDGIANYKILIIKKARQDTTLLNKRNFGESNYAIRPIERENALRATEVFKDTAMYMEYEEEFELVRMLTTYFSTDDNRYYELKIIASMVEEDDLVADLLHALLWLYLAVIASAFIINNWVLRKIWRPFYQLQHELRGFRLGEDKVFNPPQTKVSEFRDMNNTVAELLKANIAVFQNQKHFIENASHELQTPLAISLNKLELLLEQIQGEDTQAQLLANAIQHLERMTRLNKSLLLLSKIENKQFSKEEYVDFNVRLQQQIEDFSELLQYKRINLAVAEQARLKLLFNVDLADVLISNLLKNAIVHNHEEGRIDITVTTNGFEIANTGKAQALEPEKIFTRFYRSTDYPSSTGLGLAIVKAIAQRYQANVAYRYDGGMHRIVFSTRQLI
ncbi:PorY family sensor histidine kinase [Parapedobacter koreensis]|uniref:histidine kinase n=1 Tax=Parapedobacter koreensis TaxID=332977 RepID=A0A1H7IN77_9SPHI|nr:HAMP domain-containing sensor histidine kinase [Parapedobacter koreensis]SEK63020.1 Signal transduction histidine kinase [Parapedobacter koreensis]